MANEQKKDEIKVEIEDDTPPEDRNRAPLPKEILEDLDKDSLEEYSEKVQNRIKVARKAYHDERREKERATREREEALRFAQQAMEENKHLKTRLGVGEKIFAEETTRAATTELQMAKEKLRQAHESGDTDKLLEAQEAFADAKLKLRDASNFRPSLQPAETGVEITQQVQPAQQQFRPDPKSEAWKEANGWFGSDEEMTALALGLHEKLVRSGVDPRSDDYYHRIDETMKKRFPEYFTESQNNNSDDDKPSVRRTSTVVAPATRSTAPRQVRISASEAAIAKRLGLTPEAYAREKIKLENNNGR